MQLDFPVSASQLHTLRTGAAVVRQPAALFQVEGPAALDCLQGLLTSDLVASGDRSLGYGAMLTNKGMILLDPLVFREGGRFTLLLPWFARATALGHLTRMLPPRLAKLHDRTEDLRVVWLLGGDGCLLAAAGPLMPFAAVLIGSAAETAQFLGEGLAAGMVCEGESLLAAARVLAGWPSLGREIDEKTLPQEVRYDELGAVSYTKGCYTGQETVARVHFRGHPNRTLRGITLDGGRPPADRRLEYGGKEVGRIRTALILESRVLGLATLRREVPDEAVMNSLDREARVVPLPIGQEVTV